MESKISVGGTGMASVDRTGDDNAKDVTETGHNSQGKFMYNQMDSQPSQTDRNQSRLQQLPQNTNAMNSLEVDRNLTNIEDNQINSLPQNELKIASTKSPRNAQQHVKSNSMGKRLDEGPQNTSALTNMKEEALQKSDTKSKGSFGNAAGSIFGKLFKKKDRDEEGNQKANQNDQFNVDIAKLKGEARYLNLGSNKTYKSKVIQDRWEKQRAMWLSKSKHIAVNGVTKEIDPRDGVPADMVPIDHSVKSRENEAMSVRKKIKHVMRSQVSPYEPFESYYPLEEVVDTYMEIWYQSDSSDSSTL